MTITIYIKLKYERLLYINYIRLRGLKQPKQKLNESSSTFCKLCSNLLMLILCPNRWFGRLLQCLIIYTKKEHFREFLGGQPVSLAPVFHRQPWNSQKTRHTLK